jgi:hypothetical protein
MVGSFLPGWPGRVGNFGESAMVFIELDRSRPGERGDSEAAAASLGKHPVAHRISRLPRACIPSRWDETGRPTEALAKGIVCTDAMPQLLSSALHHQPFHFASKLFWSRR